MGTSIRLGILRSCTNAERLAVSFPGGSVVYEHDTGDVYLRATDGADALIWVLLAQSAAGGVIVVDLQVDEELVVALPDINAVPDGATYTYVVNNSSLGSAVAVLTAAAGQFVGQGANDWYRLSEGGSVTIRASDAQGRWNIVGEYLGTPQDLAISADSATGADDNPGTVARPAQTLRASLALCGAPVAGWSRRAVVQLASGYEDDPNGASLSSVPIEVPSARTTSGLPVLIRGGLVDDPDFPAKTCTGSSAGSAVAPIAFPRGTFGADAGYAADAAAFKFLEWTGGPYDGQVFVCNHSTNVLVEFPGTGVAPGNNVFQVQLPDATLNSTLEILFCGGPVIMYGVDLQPDSGEDVFFQDQPVGLSAVRCLGKIHLVSVSNLLAGPYLGGGTAQSGDAPTLIAAAFDAYGTTVLPTIGVGFAGGLHVSGGSTSYSGQCAHRLLLVAAGGSANAAETSVCLAGDFGAATVTQGGSAYFNLCMAYAGVNVSYAGILAVIGLTANHADGSGIIVFLRGLAQINSVRGTLTAGGSFGVKASSGGHVCVTDPGAGTTITGATGDVELGVAGTQTWADIAAAAVADTLELVGAGATATVVSPSL